MKAFAIMAVTLIFAMPVRAEETYMSASRRTDYHTALDELSIAIMDHGYTVVKIQPVDHGLRSKGYTLYEDYEIVFFSSKEMEQKLLATDAQMATLLPLKFILYREKRGVVAVAPMIDGWRDVFRSETAHALIKEIDRDVREMLQQYGGAVRPR